MKYVLAVSSLILLAMVGVSTGGEAETNDNMMMMMMMMMMNSDSDNMMPLMMMMMTMENKQNNNMLPLLIISMMNKAREAEPVSRTGRGWLSPTTWHPTSPGAWQSWYPSATTWTASASYSPGTLAWPHSAPTDSPTEYEWCYKKEDCAEETWKAEFATCNGFHQSPIDVIFTGTPVDDASDADNGALTFVGYDTADNKLKNKGGKTVQIDVSNSAAVLSGGPLGSDYKVLQLHFHWGSDDTQGSEHFYDGQAYPMEVHIVHFKAAYEGDLDKILNSVDGLAVTGLMFSVGAENAALKPITDALTNINEADSYVELTGFRLDQLIAPAIGDGNTYATYPGGLTTPPCNEVVTWLNFKQSLTVSAGQLQAFRELKDGKGGVVVNNYRSPQPTAGRVPTLYN